MTRELKFRAWGIKDKKWLKFDDHLTIVDESDYWHQWVIAIGDNGLHFLDDMGIEICQYTGLKDKNGKEIYEGDIVRLDNEVGEINYHSLFYAFMFTNENGRSYLGESANFTISDENDNKTCPNIEVIGNIYENGDLLK